MNFLYSILIHMELFLSLFIHNYLDICINKNEKMHVAIKVLNEANLKILFVVNNEKKLLGTITDGDVRRSLIREFSMDTLVTEIMNSSPKYCHDYDPFIKKQEIMKINGVNILPVLNDKNVICGLETIYSNKSPTKVMSPVVIIAGGFGKRLGNLTKHKPKPMVEVSGKPILEHTINQLSSQGFKNIYISTRYKSDIIINHFNTGKKWDVNISYLQEGTPLGTAGPLSLMKKFILDQPILVMNGDLMTSINFNHLLSYHVEEQNVCTICVSNFKNQIPYGVVSFNGSKLEKIVEKPIYNNLIVAGIYVLNSKLINSIEKDTFLDMPDFINSIKNKQNVGVFPIHEYWTDIGQKDDLQKANLEYKDKSSA